MQCGEIKTLACALDMATEVKKKLKLSNRPKRKKTSTDRK